VTIKRDATPPVITVSSEISNGDSFTVDEFGDSTVPSEPTAKRLTMYPVLMENVWYQATAKKLAGIL